MELICIFLIIMPSIGVLALPSPSERDLELVTDTSTEPLKRVIAELDEKINSVLWSSNDSTSLDTFDTYLDLRSKLKQIYWDQRWGSDSEPVSEARFRSPTPRPSEPVSEVPSSPKSCSCPSISDWYQKLLSTHLAAYTRDVSIVFVGIGLIVFLISLSNDLMYRLFREDNRSITMKIAFVVLPVVPIIILYWWVTVTYRLHLSHFHQM